MSPIPDEVLPVGDRTETGQGNAPIDPTEELWVKVSKIANDRLRRDIESAEIWERQIRETTGE